MQYTDLSDFIHQTKIHREKGIAQIAVDYCGAGFNRPLFLMGFSCKDLFSDYEIYEYGWCYYNSFRALFH